MIIDDLELRGLIADLGKVPGRAVKPLDAVVKRGAQNLKDEYNGQFARSRHFKGAAGSVTYDSTTSIGRISYEVGPDKERRAGALGNLFFFGGANGGGGTGDLDGPVDAEEPRMMENIEKVMGDLL